MPNLPLYIHSGYCFDFRFEENCRWSAWVYKRQTMLEEGANSEGRYIIERDGRPLGVVISEPHGFVVFACSSDIWPLDGKVFQSLERAERQITRLAKDSKAEVIKSPVALGR